MRNYYLALLVVCLFTACLQNSLSPDAPSVGVDSPIDFTVRKDGESVVAIITNKSQVNYTTRTTNDGSLVYDGIYAFDSLYCQTGEVRLFSATDVFNYVTDTLRPEESKNYKLSLYNPFISDILDSTSIYAFSFLPESSKQVKATQYLLSARRKNGLHQLVSTKSKLFYPDGKTVDIITTELRVCERLNTVDLPN